MDPTIELDAYPNWVRTNPKKYIERLRYEATELYRKFPNIGIYRLQDTLYLEGPAITLSKNQYTLRVTYPEKYPFEKPEAYVRDSDVIDYCKLPGNAGHGFHNTGIDSNGLRLCLMSYQDTVNTGWTPNQTGLTILEYAIMWLHAYEFKRARGFWPLPE